MNVTLHKGLRAFHIGTVSGAKSEVDALSAMVGTGRENLFSAAAAVLFCNTHKLTVSNRDDLGRYLSNQLWDTQRDTLPVFRVSDHLGRSLAYYRDLKTNEGAERRARRQFSTGSTIERFRSGEDTQPHTVWRIDTPAR